MRAIFHCVCLCSLLLTQATGLAQPKPATRHVDSKLGPEEENLNVLQQWIKWSNPGSVLMHHLISQADAYYAARDAEVAKLKNGKDWRDRQAAVQARLMEIVGPFPERTPLQPVVTGSLKKKGYTVEKIVFQSMPGFYVTGCLFIPDGIRGRAPAVLNVIGHEQESYKAELDQVIILNLVNKE